MYRNYLYSYQYCGPAHRLRTNINRLLLSPSFRQHFLPSQHFLNIGLVYLFDRYSFPKNVFNLKCSQSDYENNYEHESPGIFKWNMKYMKQTTNLQSIKPAINNISNHHFISCTIMRNELSIYFKRWYLSEVCWTPRGKLC